LISAASAEADIAAKAKRVKTDFFMSAALLLLSCWVLPQARFPGMSAEPPASPETWLARILAWPNEKFTRNFSVGKNLWDLPKTGPNGLIFSQYKR
jgi:hypothetical protein